MIDNKETLKPFCSYSFALVFFIFNYLCEQINWKRTNEIIESDRETLKF